MGEHCKQTGCYMFAPGTDARTECEAACRLERRTREDAARERRLAHTFLLLTAVCGVDEACAMLDEVTRG